jgi:glycosyltransferase involved in cell wall biosynthesis
MNVGLVAVDFYPNVGGIAAHVFELGRALVRLGHRVYVYTVPLLDEPAGTSELDGMIVRRVPMPKLKLMYSRGTRSILRRAIEADKIEVFHVHGIRPLEATRGLSVPVLFTNHSSGFLKRVDRGPAHCRRIAKRMTHLSHVLAPSRELADRTRDAGFTGPVDYIPNGVDIHKFQPGESTLRSEWGIDDATPVLLLARRLVEKNGVVVFAQALTRIAHLDWAAVFAGDGQERGKVQAILEAGGVADRCRLLGNVPNRQMTQIYRAADISFLPSFMEATSITGLESMATALPLIGTRVGGIPDLIEHDRSGLLVAPGNPSELSTAIANLVVDREKRKSMGNMARRRAIELFSWDSIAQRTMQVYCKYTWQMEAAA